MPQEKTLIVYQATDGACPFNAWLDGLRDVRARARIRARLNRLRAGLLGDAKPVGDGVHELRISEGKGYRVYFANVETPLCCCSAAVTRERKAEILDRRRDFMMTTKAKQKVKSLKAAVAYEDGLHADLQDKDFVAEYLNAAMEEGNDALFLIALRDVVKAQGGVTSVAQQADLSRTNLYSMLSDKGNPRFHNLLDLLRSLGLGLQVKPS